MYSATTRAIKVTVEPHFLEDQSSPVDDHFVWAYRVRIENQGGETVQLRRRHWRITDGMGRVQEVRGPGVVGVLSGVPLVYSKLCPGASTGCSPTTPGPRTSWTRPIPSVMRQWRRRSCTVSPL